jgi:hypothetical protein
MGAGSGARSEERPDVNASSPDLILEAAQQAVNVWHDVAMTPRLKRVLEAIFWFVLGHLSCAVMHHMGTLR